MALSYLYHLLGKKMNCASLGKQDSACSACYKTRENRFETKLCHCQSQFLKRKMRDAASTHTVTCQDCIAIARSYKKVFENT